MTSAPRPLRGTPPTRFTGLALVRLLARMAESGEPAAAPSLPERLAQWLGWADAIALAGALDAPPEAAAALPCTTNPAAELAAEERELQRVRHALTAAIADELQPPTRARRAALLPAATTLGSIGADSDFGALRRRYAARQQAMEVAIGVLRGRLRDALATRSPALARLAAVDAAMEQALGEREQGLLAGVPSLLEKRWERLRQAQADDAGDAWLDTFRRELHAVLLAELELRLQPASALLAALRGATDGAAAPHPVSA